MAKSLPLWAIAIACFCTDWLFYMLLTSMPTFMSSVLHFDLSEVSAALRLVSAAAMGLGCSLGWKYAVSSGIFLPEDLWLWDQQCRSLQAPGCVVLLPAVQNGLLSSLPYIGNGLGHILAGLLADFLLARRVLGTAAVRKLFSALGRNRLSSAVQPSQCAHVAHNKTCSLLCRDAAPLHLPGGCALHRLQLHGCGGPPNAGVDDNQHDRGRHQH